MNNHSEEKEQDAVLRLAAEFDAFRSLSVKHIPEESVTRIVENALGKLGQSDEIVAETGGPSGEAHATSQTRQRLDQCRPQPSSPEYKGRWTRRCILAFALAASVLVVMVWRANISEDRLAMERDSAILRQRTNDRQANHDGVKPATAMLEPLNDIHLRHLQAEAFVNLAEAHGAEGKTSEAMAAYGRAVACFREAAYARPAGAELSRFFKPVGGIPNGRGIDDAIHNREKDAQTSMRNRRRLDEAINNATKAVKIYTRLVQDGEHTQLRLALADALVNRGDFLAAKGELSAAATDFELALRIIAELIDEGQDELTDELQFVRKRLRAHTLER